MTEAELKQFIAEQVQQEVARRLAKLEKPILDLVQHLSKMEDHLKMEDRRAQALQELLEEGLSGMERMEPRAQDMETMMSEIERLLHRTRR